MDQPIRFPIELTRSPESGIPRPGVMDEKSIGELMSIDQATYNGDFDTPISDEALQATDEKNNLSEVVGISVDPNIRAGQLAIDGLKAEIIPIHPAYFPKELGETAVQQTKLAGSIEESKDTNDNYNAGRIELNPTERIIQRAQIWENIENKDEEVRATAKRLLDINTRGGYAYHSVINALRILRETPTSPATKGDLINFYRELVIQPDDPDIKLKIAERVMMHSGLKIITDTIKKEYQYKNADDPLHESVKLNIKGFNSGLSREHDIEVFASLVKEVKSLFDTYRGPADTTLTVAETVSDHVLASVSGLRNYKTDYSGKTASKQTANAWQVVLANLKSQPEAPYPAA